LEDTLGRVINTENAGKDRTHLVKAIVLTIRELAQQREPGIDARDMAAFISLALEKVFKTIEPTVSAWEKRGYWVKADKFRLEWTWAEDYSQKMRDAVMKDDWLAVSQIATRIAQKLGGITIPIGHHIGTPWVGAWDLMEKSKR
jgi:hypothetical protein